MARFGGVGLPFMFRNHHGKRSLEVLNLINDDPDQTRQQTVLSIVSTIRADSDGQISHPKIGRVKGPNAPTVVTRLGLGLAVGALSILLFCLATQTQRRRQIRSQLNESMIAIESVLQSEIERRVDGLADRNISQNEGTFEVRRRADQSIQISPPQSRYDAFKFDDSFWEPISRFGKTCFIGPASLDRETDKDRDDAGGEKTLWVAFLVDNPTADHSQIHRASTNKLATIKQNGDNQTIITTVRISPVDTRILSRWIRSNPRLDLQVIDRYSNIMCFGVSEIDPEMVTFESELLRGGGGGRFEFNWFRETKTYQWIWDRDWQIGCIISRLEEPLVSPWALLWTILPLGITILLSPILSAPAKHLWRSAVPFAESSTKKTRADDPRSVAVGDQLGNYLLCECVGRGSMGVVYRGVHRLLKREAAIKVLNRNAVPRSALRRFEKEVRLTSRLKHPNTISIFDYGQTDSDFYYVMEFVDGMTLADLVAVDGAQPASRVIHLLLQVCGSMSEAHGLGLIHRDIKPANLLVSGGLETLDLVKVVDFGLIKDISNVDPSMTRNDSITGTPMFMSPEAVRDAASANTQSDLYSIGAVGYTLLTGLPMFEAGSSVEICVKQIHETPITPTQRCQIDIPADLERVLMIALEKDPVDRWASVGDFAEALRQCRDANDWSGDSVELWWQNWRAKQEEIEKERSVDQAEQTVRSAAE